mmetsp:Transcript_4942/g.15454  ORF Transcript_4942/g.15454 Transcript_4942/m.15454 type:complete len:221 (-) Transcript_4942:955-1617(-)
MRRLDLHEPRGGGGVDGGLLGPLHAQELPAGVPAAGVDGGRAAVRPVRRAALLRGRDSGGRGLQGRDVRAAGVQLVERLPVVRHGGGGGGLAAQQGPVWRRPGIKLRRCSCRSCTGLERPCLHFTDFNSPTFGRVAPDHVRDCDNLQRPRSDSEWQPSRGNPEHATNGPELACGIVLLLSCSHHGRAEQRTRCHVHHHWRFSRRFRFPCHPGDGRHRACA